MDGYQQLTNRDKERPLANKRIAIILCAIYSDVQNIILVGDVSSHHKKIISDCSRQGDIRTLLRKMISHCNITNITFHQPNRIVRMILYQENTQHDNICQVANITKFYLSLERYLTYVYHIHGVKSTAASSTQI